MKLGNNTKTCSLMPVRRKKPSGLYLGFSLKTKPLKFTKNYFPNPEEDLKAVTTTERIEWFRDVVFMGRFLLKVLKIHHKVSSSYYELVSISGSVFSNLKKCTFFEVWGKCVVINCKILSNKLFKSSFIIGQSRNFSNLEFLWKCWILRLEHG